MTIQAVSIRHDHSGDTFLLIAANSTYDVTATIFSLENDSSILTCLSLSLASVYSQLFLFLLLNITLVLEA